MSYLKQNEIEKYCGLVSGVTMEQVEAASALIDAFKGCSLLPTKHTELVTLNFKRTAMEVRGKLQHFPRVSIDKIQTDTMTPFGKDRIALNESCLEFDGDDSLYFSFYFPRELMFHKPPKKLLVEYTSGYEIIPEQVKRACGILACNIKQMGGVMKWKSRDDYDIKVTLGNEGVFTDEIKSILRGVKVQ